MSGQEHDLNAYPALIEEIDDDPQHAAKRGAQALIPTKKNRKVQQIVDKPIYASQPHRTHDQSAQEFRCIARRDDELIGSFSALVLLCAIRLWFRFVQTA